jgi:hypothetical protein
VNGGEGSFTIAPGLIMAAMTSRRTCMRNPGASPVVAARHAAKSGRSDNRRNEGRGSLRCRTTSVGASGIRKGKASNVHP